MTHHGSVLTRCWCLLCDLLLEVLNSLISLQMPPYYLFSSTSVEGENAAVSLTGLKFSNGWLIHFICCSLFSLKLSLTNLTVKKNKTGMNNIKMYVQNKTPYQYFWNLSWPTLLTVIFCGIQTLFTLFGMASASQLLLFATFVAYCNMCVLDGHIKVLPDCRCDFLLTPSQNPCALAWLDSSMRNWSILSVVDRDIYIYIQRERRGRFEKLLKKKKANGILENHPKCREISWDVLITYGTTLTVSLNV